MKEDNYLDELFNSSDSDFDFGTEKNDDDDFMKQFEQELKENEDDFPDSAQSLFDNIDQIVDGIGDSETESQNRKKSAAGKRKSEEEQELMRMLSGESDAGENEIGIDEENPFAENVEDTLEEQQEETEENGKRKKKRKSKEKKQKKTGEKSSVLQKISNILFGEEDDIEEKIKKLPESVLNAPPDSVLELTGDELDILNELEKRKIKPSEEKGKKKKEKKKKEKKEKKEKKPKEKKPRPKKQRKPKPPAEPDNTPPLPRVPVILIFVMAGSLLVLIVSGTNLLGYSNSFSEAKKAYLYGNYIEAFEAVAGANVKDKDMDEYEKYHITAMVYAEYEAFESMFDAQVYDIALDSLIRTVQRYDKYFGQAEAYECTYEFEDILQKAETALAQHFGMTVNDAREVYLLEQKTDYSRKIHSILKEMGLSEV